DQITSRMAEAAVDWYVHPPGTDYLERLQARSANEAAQKVALLELHATDASDLLDELRAVRHEYEIEKAEATRAREQAEAQQREAEARLADLEAARAQQQAFASQVELRLSTTPAE